MLQDVAQQVSSFKSSKDDVSRILKDVADYVAPGLYVLKDYVQRKELEPMQKALTDHPPVGILPLHLYTSFKGSLNCSKGAMSSHLYDHTNMMECRVGLEEGQMLFMLQKQYSFSRLPFKRSFVTFSQC